MVSNFARSPAMVRASMPCFESCAAASSSSPCLRAVMATFAPSSPSASAICKPRPREPPVISAVLPERSNRSLTLMCSLSSPPSSALEGTFASRGRHVREDPAGAQDAPLADPEMACREGEPLSHLLHVDPRLNPISLAGDVGEVGAEVDRHHRARRRARRRDHDAQGAVCERDQLAAVRDAASVQVPLVDAQPDDDVPVVSLGIERPERGQESAVHAPQLLESCGNVRRLAQCCSPSRSTRPFSSARCAWCAMTRTQWMRLAKRGSRVCPSTYRL